MSEHQNSAEEKQSEITSEHTNTPIKKRNKWAIQRSLIYIGIGLLIGYFLAQQTTYSLSAILPALMAIFVAVFFVIVILILALPRIINFLVKRYTGREFDVETATDEGQTKLNKFADNIAVVALNKSQVPEDVKNNIRSDIPDIIYYFGFMWLRSSGLRFLITVFVVIGGLMGTILLYNQNQLLQSQNIKIDNQIQLEEASRRSSLNFLMANVLDKIDLELRQPKDTTNHIQLSEPLIGRIASLAQSFKPYQFLEKGELIPRELSPERGNFLIALVNSGLDSTTLAMIFNQSSFSASYLVESNLNMKNLHGAKLFYANLSRASLREADLREVRLRGANLNKADLFYADLRKADFVEADLREAILAGANLREAYLFKADLRGAKLQAADIHGAYLQEADLRGVSLTKEQIMSVSTLYMAKGIDNIFDQLREEKPCLFTEKGCNPFFEDM
ncbi:MAG: hypothetical protein Sapg2KO_12430 [Saprospiraceae bacterium]